MQQPKIDVRIPFEPGAQLGADYNRIFAETAHPWVLLLDHDVLLLNPHWYHVAQTAIGIYPRTGVFTCRTNRIGNPEQRFEPGAAAGDDIMAHRALARSLFEAEGCSATVIDGAKCSGMFLLVSVEAWRAAGGFPGVGMFREDWQFGARVKRAGYAVRRLDGLYVYHVRDRSEGSWIAGVDTSKEIRDRLYAEGKIGKGKGRK